MKIAILPVDKQGNDPQQNIYLSTEIAYIVTYLETIFPDDLFFPWAHLSTLGHIQPDLFCIYAPYSWTYDYVIEMCNSIKEIYGKPVILLGEHISSIPKSLPPNADIGILGDTELTLPTVFELFKNQKLDDKNLSKVSSIVFNAKSRKIITSPPQYLSDIESWNMTRSIYYQLPGNWTPSIISGRGKASVNAWQPLTNEPVRLFSIEKMMKDIADVLVNYNDNKVIEIKDYLLLYDRKRFKKFVEMYKETQLHKYMHFEINTMIYQLDEEIISDLKEVLNVPKLNINFLSPLEKSNKEIKERFVSYKEQQNILDLCFRYNLNVNAKFLYNLPNETIEDTTKSYWLIKRNYLNKYDNLNISISPYIYSAGTELWQKMSAKKIITEFFDGWTSLSKYDLSTPTLSYIKGSEIDKIQECFNKLSEQRNDSFTANIKEKSKEHFNKLNKSSDQLFDKIKENFLGSPLQNLIEDDSIFKVKSNYKNSEKNNLSNNLLLEFERLLISDDTLESIKAKMSKLKFIYNKINEDYSYHILYNTINLTYLTLDNILKEITNRYNDKKTLLQVSNTSIIDFKKLFKSDYIDVDTLETEKFNNPSFKPDPNIKYDIIVLYLTPNIVLSFKDTLRLCKNILKDDGIIITTFFNPKSVISLTRLVTDLDLRKWVYGHKRTSLFTLSAMENLIKKEGFLTKEVEKIEFPNAKFMSPTLKILNHFSKVHLLPHVISDDTEIMFYTYSFRKNLKS